MNAEVAEWLGALDTTQIISPLVCVLWLVTFGAAMLEGPVERLSVSELLAYSPLWLFPPLVILVLAFGNDVR